MDDVGDDGRPRVLVVDDERRVTDMYARWLGEDGPYEVETVNSGPAALQMVDGEFDAALIDRNLRSTSGAEVVSKLRDRGHEFPVALVTVADPDEEVAGLDYQRYLTKPVMGGVLRETVAEMLSDDGSGEEGDPGPDDGDSGNEDDATDSGRIGGDDVTDPGGNETDDATDPTPDDGGDDPTTIVDRIRASLDGEWPDDAIDVPGVERAMPISGEASSVSLDGDSGDETIVVPGLQGTEASDESPPGEGSDGSGATDGGDAGGPGAADSGGDGDPDPDPGSGVGESRSDHPLLGDVSGEMNRLQEELDTAEEGDGEE